MLRDCKLLPTTSLPPILHVLHPLFLPLIPRTPELHQTSGHRQNPDSEAMRRISAPFLKRRATERATKQWRNQILKLNQEKNVLNLPAPNSKPKTKPGLQRHGQSPLPDAQCTMTALFLKTNRWKWIDSEGCCWCNEGERQVAINFPKNTRNESGKQKKAGDVLT